MREKENRTDVDVVNAVLEDCIIAFPVSSFVISLYQQYQKRGYLTKKQLQGLHGKASKISDISPGKLATLEAIINKMPTRFKSDKPEVKPIVEREDDAVLLINEILTKYPMHKRVLFFKSKIENKESLSMSEM